nr:hypothetical protein [Tanacetum cinerariifolium]
MPVEDDILPAEEQPLPAAALPATEFDPDEDLKDDPEEDPMEDPADYPADEGDEGDEKDESSDDDEDNDIDIEGDEEEDESFDDDKDDDIDIKRDEEEDEYLAPANSTAVALPAIDHAPSAKETELFETHKSSTTPPPHPAYRKRLCTAHTGTYELGESSAAAAARLSEPVRDDLYRFVDTIEQGEGSTPAAMESVTELSTTFDRETSMIYAMIEEKQNDQALQRARVNRLFKDRRYHAHTTRLIEGETRASRTAWTQSMDASDVARSGVIALRTQILEVARVPAQPKKMAPKRTTRANPATTTTTTTSVTDAQLEAPIEQDVPKALAARDAEKTRMTMTAIVPAQPKKMAPKRTTRANPATTTTTTTSVTDAQLEAPIEQDVPKALAARDAEKTRMTMTAMFQE